MDHPGPHRRRVTCTSTFTLRFIEGNSVGVNTNRTESLGVMNRSSHPLRYDRGDPVVERKEPLVEENISDCHRPPLTIKTTDNIVCPRLQKVI